MNGLANNHVRKRFMKVQIGNITRHQKSEVQQFVPVSLEIAHIKFTIYDEKYKKKK